MTLSGERVLFTPSDLEALLELNQLREHGHAVERELLEQRFANAFSVHRHLAVYGTLAPGRPNHHQLSQVGGEWHSGYSVTGELSSSGWAADLGFPALRWSPNSDAVPVELFVSPALPHHWSRLDTFEGPEYLRILVPVYLGPSVATLANIYAARP